MTLGILELSPASVLTDAVLLYNFASKPLLAVSCECMVKFYEIEPNFNFVLSKTFKIYGKIANIIDLTVKDETALFILREDLSFTIVKLHMNDLTTIQTGNISASLSPIAKPPFKIKKLDDTIVIKVSETVLLYMKILDNFSVTIPFPIATVFEELYDFCLIPLEYDKNPKILCVGHRTKTTEEGETFTSVDFVVSVLDEYEMKFVHSRPEKAENSPYFLHSIGDRRLIGFSSSCATVYKFVDNNLRCFLTGQPISTTIYTQGKICRLVTSDAVSSIAVDEAYNLYYITYPPDAAVTCDRVCSVNPPITIFRFMQPLVQSKQKVFFAVSASGHSSILTLSLNESRPHVDISVRSFQSSEIKSIIPYSNSGEYISLTTSNHVNLIRRYYQYSLIGLSHFPSAENVWYINEDIFVVSTNRSSTAYDSSAQFQPTDIKLVQDQKTIEIFVVPDGFIQVATNILNINISKNPVHVLFNSEALCANFCSDKIIVGLSLEGSSYEIVIYDLKGAELRRFNTNGLCPTAVCLYCDMMVFSNWSKNVIMFYNSNNELVHSIANKTVVSLAAIDDSLYMLCDKEEIIVTKYDVGTEQFSSSHLHCNGSHTKFSHTTKGILVSGDTPFILKRDRVIGFEIDNFFSGSIFNDHFCYIRNQTLYFNSISVSKMSSYSVRLEFDAIISISLFRDKGIYLMIILCRDTENSIPCQYLCLSNHPLEFPYYRKPFDHTHNNVVKMTATIEINDRMFAAVVVGKGLVLFEAYVDYLDQRFRVDLQNEIIFVAEYKSYLLVVTPKEIIFYRVVCFSYSSVSLEQAEVIRTLGSTSCIAISEYGIAVGDELESIVVYELDIDRDRVKYTEILRNVDSIGITSLGWIEDTVIAGDTDGCLHTFDFVPECKNIYGSDLKLTKTFNLNSVITTMCDIGNEMRVILGSESGALFALSEIDLQVDPDEFKLLNETLENNFVSIGELTPMHFRSFIKDGFILPCGLYDFSLFLLYINLSRELKETLASMCRMTVDRAEQICYSILEDA